MAPKWAYDPLSGAGAARNGGRFNAVGVPALYFSDTIETALAEYSQDLPDRPGTFCAYTLDIGGIVDLTAPSVRDRLGVDEALLASPWKKIALIEKSTPPTWTLARTLIDGGYTGVIAPSVVRPRGRNIVLWRWNADPGVTIRYHDPNSDLPTAPIVAPNEPIR